jgi:hypothetical protein
MLLLNKHLTTKREYCVEKRATTMKEILLSNILNGAYYPTLLTELFREPDLSTATLISPTV